MEPAADPAVDPAPSSSTAQTTLLDAPYAQRYKEAKADVPAFLAKPEYNSSQFMPKVRTALHTYGVSQADEVTFTLSRLQGEASNVQLELAQEDGITGLSLDQLEMRLLARFPFPTLERPQYQLVNSIHMKGNNIAKLIQETNTQAGPRLERQAIKPCCRNFSCFTLPTS